MSLGLVTKDPAQVHHEPEVLSSGLVQLTELKLAASGPNLKAQLPMGQI